MKVKLFCRGLDLIRSNITAFSVVFLLSSVSLSNIMISDYSFQKDSILFGYLDEKGISYDRDGNIIVESSSIKTNTQQTNNSSINLVRVASADTTLWSKTLRNSEDDSDGKVLTISANQENNINFSPMLVQSDSLVATVNFYDEADYNEQRYGIIKYTVEEGDTPSSIASSFGISTYTLLWANDLKVGNYIKPGQVLEILPVTGVKHVIEEGDSIDSIAKKYDADTEEIITYNELPANGQLTVGRTLIVPNGEKEKPVDEPEPQSSYSAGTIVSSGKYTYSSTTQQGHVFPYGQCTWYVATRTYVPWGGNAKNWLANSRAYGFSTGTTPMAGAIVVTTEHRIYGHVAYVESVSSTTITISEMNYVGWARKSVRVLPINSSVIVGYVYPKN